MSCPPHLLARAAGAGWRCSLCRQGEAAGRAGGAGCTLYALHPLLLPTCHPPAHPPILFNPPALFMAQPSTCDHHRRPHRTHLLQRCPPVSHCITAMTQSSPTTLDAPSSLRQPPASHQQHTPAPTTTIPGVGWQWVRTARGGAEARRYMRTSWHHTPPPALTYRDPAPAPAPPCATAVIAPPPPTVLLSPSPMTGHNSPPPAPQPHTICPPTIHMPIVTPHRLPQVSPTATAQPTSSIWDPHDPPSSAHPNSPSKHTLLWAQ